MLKKIYYLLAALLLLTTLSLSAGCGSKNQSQGTAPQKATFRSMDEIKKSGKLIIGVFSDKAPFGYVDKDGNYQGYDLSLIHI